MIRFYPFMDVEETNERPPTERNNDRTAPRTYRPPVDVFEDEKGLYLTVYLPGVDTDHIEVNTEENTLTVRAQRPFERQENVTYHRIEGAYGSFARTFTVPATFDLTNTGASYRNGLLMLFVPRSEASKPRKIDIRSE